jgi:molybdopterin converting factor small subunit
VLLNGNDIAFGAGLETPVNPGDDLQIFPPGR